MILKQEPVTLIEIFLQPGLFIIVSILKIRVNFGVKKGNKGGQGVSISHIYTFHSSFDVYIFFSFDIERPAETLQPIRLIVI